MTMSCAAEEAALRGVKRLCYAGLDSVTLRKQVVRPISAVVGYDLYSFATADPETGLLTHVVAEGVPPTVARAFALEVYPQQEAERMLDRVRSGEDVSTSTSAIFTEMLRDGGMARELNTILRVGDGLWGDLCLARETGSAAYGERELRFMRRVAPHLARGIRTSATVDAASATAPGPEPDPEPGSPAPGVVVVDARGRVVLQSASATAALADLADVGVELGALPSALWSTVSLLRARQRQPAPDAARGDASLRVRGRSGHWYVLRACLAQPTPCGETHVILTLEPAARREVAAVLTRLYGLSPREREIVALTARGESTKSIAARMCLSTYTIQEHLGHACEKVGVRGRRALLAKLYFDGYAPAQHH